jgi:glycosyltransferase involved in cell wall biosynthesis
MNRFRVSVICPFHNSERFLAEAIDSVLGQDFDDCELLLVDDGSTDTSTGIARDYEALHPDRVRYLEHAGHANHGAAASRNLGLEQSSSELAAFIDSDDRWRPGKLAEQVAILEGHPDVGMVCGAVNYWRSWDMGADKVWTSARGILRPPETALRLYPLGPGIAPCPSDVLARRSVVEAVGGFEPEFVGPGNYEDQAFLVKLYFTTPVYFAPNVWLDYRQHEESGMAKGVREDSDRKMRLQFLDWLTHYVAEHDLAGKTAVWKAIERDRWELDHPMMGTLLKKGRGLAHALLH